jgi:hypothetical protein
VAATPSREGDQRRWQPRPLLSLAVRGLALILPLACALAVNAVIGRALGPPSGPAIVVWVVFILAVSSTTLVLVYRLTRRLLPLAVLLDFSLAFPDSAPSRFAVARQRPNLKDLQAQLAEAYALGETGAPVERAELIVTLAISLSAHDARTRGHSERVRLLTEMLADELHLSGEERDRLRWAALLHDIGKLTVPAEVLNKPGRPDEREWALLKAHPAAGSQFVRTLLPWLGDDLGGAVEHHHERFDGSGYPHGLGGEAISHGGRIVAVADSFEVMTAARPYKRPMTPQAARQELVRCAGSHFDPAVVRAFLGISLGRLWLAVGPSALLAQVPLLARLPEALGRRFYSAVGAASTTSVSAVMVGSLAAAGVFSSSGLIQPVALSGPSSFGRLLPPFTAAHEVITGNACLRGVIGDRSHLLIDTCAHLSYEFSLTGGSTSRPLATADSGLTDGLAVQGGVYYGMADSSFSDAPSGLYTFDPSTLRRTGLVAALKLPRGLAADPLSGDLFASDETAGIYRVENPAGGRARLVLLARGDFDGVAVTPDGQVIYGAAKDQSIIGFDRQGRQVFRVSLSGHAPDGIAVVRLGISAGGLDLSGNVFVNSNDGTIERIDTLHGNRVSVVASGGVRGDYIAVGADGCMYATQNAKLDRLEPCVFAPSNQT